MTRGCSIHSLFVSDDLGDRLRAATELLEAVVADRQLLASLSLEDRTRLLNAAGNVYSPDVEERRRQIKSQRRQHKAQKVQRDQGSLSETGIRTLRAKAVFTTPNVFAPTDIDADDIDDVDERNARESIEPQHCYVCKQKYSRIHPF